MNAQKKQSFSISVVVAFVSLVSGSAILLTSSRPIFAQGEPPVRSLGANHAAVEGDWLVYEQLEFVGGEEDWELHVENLATGETRYLGNAGFTRILGGDWVVFGVREAEQGEDLNGDGDTEDWVGHLHSLATGETIRLPIFPVEAGPGDWLVLDTPPGPSGVVVQVHNLVTGETRNLGLEGFFTGISAGDWLVFGFLELGDDLNGDGDTGACFDGNLCSGDSVVHLHNLATGETRNLRLDYNFGSFIEVAPAQDRLVFAVPEARQGEDLNGDGDTEDFVVHLHDLATGETTNLGLTGGAVSENWLVGNVAERGRGEDLNGDGDRRDEVVHVYNLSTGEIRNLRLASRSVRHILSGEWLAFGVPESEQREDLNGDGDTDDDVVHKHNLATGETRNLGLQGGIHYELSGGDWLVFDRYEGSEGDLNGDGDTRDSVKFLHNLATGETRNLRLASGDANAWRSGDWLAFHVSEQEEDLNGDGDRGDNIVHVYNAATGETRNLGLAGFIPEELSGGDWLVFVVWEPGNRQDLNGDGDTNDRVVHVHNVATGETTNLRLPHSFFSKFDLSGDWLLWGVPERGLYYLADLRSPSATPVFRRGDCNGDGRVDIADAVFSLGSLFLGERDPGCEDACDSNDDGRVNIADAVNTLGVLFLGSGVIPLPGTMECGVDPTEDDVGCVTLTGCP